MERCPTPRGPSASVGKILLCLTLALVAFLGSSLNAVAADPPRVIALGESNDAAERAELLAYFGSTDAALLVPVTVDETLTATGDSYDLSGVDTAYSSAAISCAAAGAGVAVVTRNIEVVPPSLYALALVTAGITDVRLAVGAPDDAPALGMTALAGVFKAWDASPCGRGGRDDDRRALALDEVALVARIGQAQDTPDGVSAMASAMQNAQLHVVTDNADPEQALTASADAAGVVLTDSDMADGVAFLNRLAETGIDWNGYALGWTLAPGEKGDGVLIVPNERPAKSAVKAAVPTGVGGEIVATASPTPRQTATPAATSTAIPTATATTVPTATGTATPAAAGFAHITGTLQGGGGEGVTVAETGSTRTVNLAFVDGAAITRSGHTAQFSDLRAGDQISGTVRLGDGKIVALNATPGAAQGRGSILDRNRLAAAIGLLLLALLLALLFISRRRRPHVFARRVSPAVAAAAVARRRAAESMAHAARTVTAPRRIGVRRRNESSL